MMPPEIFFVAGEPSGDLHAAMLAAALLKQGPCRPTGAGGPRMREAGVALDLDSSDWGAIGVPQAVRKLPYLWRQKNRLLRLLEQRRPQLLVLVDFGAFNVRLARYVRRKSRHQPILYYFPPASWDKGPRDRSELARLTDAVATVFPWSEPLLRQDGVNAHFVGHPILERLEPVVDPVAARRELGLPDAQHYVGLLPGSRCLERNLLGPPYRQAMHLLAEAAETYHFLWSALPGCEAQAQAEIPPELAGRTTVVTDSGAIMRAADLLLSSFGTATLEAAVVGTPMLTMYRGTWAMRLQYRLMRIPTPFYAMPNIIAGRPLVPEFIQDEANGPNLAREVDSLLHHPESLEGMRQGFAEVRSQLGTPGASERTARLAFELIAAQAVGD